MFSRRSPFRTPSLEELESRQLLTVIMTPEEQLTIELVNRARADPAAEAERFELELNQDVEEDSLISADPKQPLAPHQALTDAAGLHSEDMLRRNYFGHNTPEGITPSDRAKEAGYPTGAGENIAWRGHSNLDRAQEVYERHEGLFESVGHRINMMRDRWREIGAGVRYGTFTQGFAEFPSIMVGTLFGNRGGNAFITGVVITDHIRQNRFYEMGEGIGEVTVTASREGTDEVYTDVTGPTGGYGVAVPNGIYTVTATGGLLAEAITVRGVKVDEANVKVDFNRARMPTRYIDGKVFADANRNGNQEATETGAAGQTVFLDYDENGALDEGEPRAATDAEGNYRIAGLLPGDYTVLLHVAARSTQTWPEDNYEVTISDRHVVRADFGMHSDNLPPVARDDQATVRGGESVLIRVLQNDFDPDDQLVAASVRVITPPQHGSVTVAASGEIIYTANADYVGEDGFVYTVGDSDGTRSNSAVTRISVTPAFPWQNPRQPLDVNDDGFVVSQDALIVIREINRVGPGSLSNRPRGGDARYYDVSGDNFLTSLDVLRVIRFLNGQAAAAGEPPAARAAAQAVDHLMAWAAMEKNDDDPWTGSAALVYQAGR